MMYRKGYMTSISSYGQIHYFTFHRILPASLFGGELSSFIRACESERQGSIILKLWGDTEFNVSDKSFPLLFDSLLNEHRLIVIGLPPPEDTPQARLIGLWFDSQDPDGTLRYFVSEKPVEEDFFGDVLGEWDREGAHKNFGPYCPADKMTSGAFIAAIQKRCGFPATDKTSNKENAIKPVNQDRIRQEVRNRIAKRIDVEQETDLSAEHQTTLDEDSKKIAWQSDSPKIATDAVARLRNLQQIGKSVMIFSAETADGLQSTVSTYLQFKVLNKKKLLVEVQGDYSYWGVSVPSGEWHNFATLGFSTPSSINGNFSITYKDFRDDEPLTVWLSQVIRLMQQVIKPRGEIGIRFF